MDTTYLKNISALWDSASLLLDEDHFFALMEMMDPDRSVGNAIHAMEEAERQAQYIAMSMAERAAYDDEVQRLHEIGLNAMRRVLAKHSGGT